MRVTMLRAATFVPLTFALNLTACGVDEFEAPPLTGAPGATTLLAPALPFIIEAEAGTTGADVQVVTDAADGSISYVTAAVNVTDAPAVQADSRVVSVEQQFPRAGTYQMYARVRIGPAAGNDDSFFIDLGTDAPTWT